MADLSYFNATATGLLFTIASATVAAQEPVEIEGKYKCEGKNPDGSTYTGTVTITKKNETYAVEWRIRDSLQTGVAIYNGGALSICWVTRHGGRVGMGVAAYQLQKDRRTFVGKWAAVGGNGKTTQEVLRKLGEKELLEVRRPIPTEGTNRQT